MISPETLRRYPFFGTLTDAQLKAVAMISEEVTFEKGATILEEGQVADSLYLLLEGDLDLYYRSEVKFDPKSRKEFLVGEVGAGEIFAISALIDPYVYSATVKTTRSSRAIKINALELRGLFNNDYEMGYHMMLQVTKLAMERLSYARIQLAAAWS